MLFYDSFDSDSEAIHNLEQVGIAYRGGLIKLIKDAIYPPQVLNAVHYLCNEWDYAAIWIDPPLM